LIVKIIGRGAISRALLDSITGRISDEIELAFYNILKNA
jgi:hypothetical protein